MKHESIKVGNTIYNIAKGSCGLNNFSEYGATVAIIIESNKLEDIHKNLMENSSVTKYSVDGAEEWKRDNLVYTGQSNFNPSFPVGIEQVQETDEGGNAITINKEVMGEVVVVEYRTPNIQDEVKAQNAQIVSLNARVAYLQMLSGIETEVGHE